MIRLSLFAVLLLSLSGCYGHHGHHHGHHKGGTSVRVDGLGEVRIDDGHGGKGGHGKKCPPGHHMKGHC